ncbi:MAG: sialidase family protein [Oscillatoria sp. PMC 1068.18]|nr:sialidase family protein [Oscillatoria sp. PMC 1076.18]MEC4987573.1 sialidase family protein [Oscillatoria sp. PMC 1068.18]
MFVKPLTKEPVFLAKSVESSECHASTLLRLPKNGYLCAWFAGSKESNHDTAIWLSEKTGENWSSPVQIAKVTDEPHWNPVLGANNGQIYLFWKVGSSPRKWRTYVRNRSFASNQWSSPQAFVDQTIAGGPVKNKPIQLENGDWLAPASVETQTAWDCFVDRSTDEGKTWQPSAFIPRNRQNFPGLGIIQPTLWESTPGHVHLLARSTAGKIYRADSLDNGYTWCEAYPTALPNNNSGIDLAKLDNGSLILVYNPVAKNWGARTPLKIALSQNNGQTWSDIFVLEDKLGEYSYPAVIKTEFGFALTYTWKRQRIQFWEFSWKADI